MKNDLIPIMKRTGRLKLSFWESLTHYMIVVFLLISPIMTAISLIEIHITQSYTGALRTEELIRTALPFLVLATILAIIQYRRLNFKKYKIIYNDEHFQDAVHRTVTDLGWRIERSNEKFLLAFRCYKWGWSWGEMITIIRGNEEVLVNSICDPKSMHSSVVSYGWNKKNITVFLKNLQDAIAGIPFVPPELKIKKEWSTKQIFTRLLAYPFSLSLIALGLYIILYVPSPVAIFAAFGAIGVAAAYLYSDIKILLNRKK